MSLLDTLMSYGMQLLVWYAFYVAIASAVCGLVIWRLVFRVEKARDTDTAMHAKS